MKCKVKAKPKGLSAKHIFSVFLVRDLAHILEMNSKNLQESDLTAEVAMDCIKKIEISLAEMRCNVEEFEKIRYKDIKEVWQYKYGGIKQKCFE